MKKIILGFAVVAFLVSCQNNKTQKKEQTIEDQVSLELNKDRQNNTIFLGLKYGMGGKEVHNYFKELTQQGKLMLVPHEYLSDKGQIYVYKYEFGNNEPDLQNILGTFKTYYIKDKLYKLRISVEPESETSLKALKLKFKELYVSEFGENFLQRENIYNNSIGYEWIIGNTSIEISEGLSNNLLIIYTQLSALKDSNETPREVLMREI